MPVSHDHLTNTVQTWNGKTYAMMAKAEAKKLEKEGVIQITTNLTASDLKTEDQFQARKKRKRYKTREMKAET